MISIISYDPIYQSAYKSLNLEWLIQYNLLEPFDEKQLDDPNGSILNQGGYIYLAKANDDIVGTAALVYDSNGIYELAKMTVAPQYRGKGISKLLIESCIQKAKELKAKKIYLYSNSQLGTAITLYEKYGFKHIPTDTIHYVTADVKMELML